MTNNKQQTAVEWFGIEMGKLFAQYHGKIICIGEFHKKRFELEEQAKEMEQNQINDAYFQGFEDNVWDSLDDNFNLEYYNETYGGGER